MSMRIIKGPVPVIDCDLCEFGHYMDTAEVAADNLEAFAKRDGWHKFSNGNHACPACVHLADAEIEALRATQPVREAVLG